MDAFLSSFNFDNLSGDDSRASDTAESETADKPADGLDDAAGFGTALTGADNADTALTGADDPFNFDDILSSFDFAPEPVKAGSSSGRCGSVG